MSTDKESSSLTSAQDLNNNGATPTDRNTLWADYCKVALNLYRSDQIAQFQANLQAGHHPLIVDPALMVAALSLVRGAAAAGVRPWTGWAPPPNAADLADPATWASQRLAAQRVAEDEAEHVKRLDRAIARALGGPQSAATGTINPVHLQQSKHDLDELARRLEWVIAEHTKRGPFRREDLDHRSPHYISDRAGGISNKQVVLMANLIVGRQEKRSYDQNWKIVMVWMRNRGATATGDGK
jgi:hypothetical protein